LFSLVGFGVCASCSVLDGFKWLGDPDLRKLSSETYSFYGSLILSVVGLVYFLGSLSHRVFLLSHPRYDASNLQKYCETKFGDTKLGEALTDILIPSYDIKYSQPRIFGWDTNGWDKDLLMKDVAIATSSAPTYFRPYSPPLDSKLKDYLFVDGGVIANDPTLVAWAYAQKEAPPDHEVFIVSLGTGEPSKQLTSNFGQGGMLSWALPDEGGMPRLLGLALDHSLASLLMPKSKKINYYRFNKEFNENIDLASTDPKHLQALEEQGKAMWMKDGNTRRNLEKVINHVKLHARVPNDTT